MLFCIFNWHKIEGLDLVLTGCLLCLTVFSILTVPSRKNWIRKGLKQAGIAMLCCELLCSLLWLLIFYPNGAYHNYGLQGALFFPDLSRHAGSFRGGYRPVSQNEKEV